MTAAEVVDAPAQVRELHQEMLVLAEACDEADLVTAGASGS
jgi:hypothetical protein